MRQKWEKLVGGWKKQKDESSTTDQKKKTKRVKSLRTIKSGMKKMYPFSAGEAIHTSGAKLINNKSLQKATATTMPEKRAQSQTE